MDVDNVWDGFFLHALVLDSQRTGRLLSLPHAETRHTNRYKDALLERNQRYSSYNRPHWSHTCDDCFKLIQRGNEQGQFHTKYLCYLMLTHPAISMDSISCSRWCYYWASLLLLP
jgi:hypothetical protein